MIFQKTIKQVLSGLKTQTRRLVQPGDTTELDSLNEIWRVYRNGRLLYQVGKTYAAQPGRGLPAAGRIRLKSIRRERVNEISVPDALAEGIEVAGREYDSRLGRFVCRYDAYNGGGSTYAPVLSFAGLWNTIHTGAAAYENGPECWCLEFELVRED